jgi:diguanylate cyclase (GGDEF)-like protein/PAS domain S-box-containing protein
MPGQQDPYVPDSRVLQQAAIDMRDGLTVADARRDDMPLVYVNPAFERLTGFSFEEAVRKNCRYLHRGDNDQEGVRIVRNALVKEESCLVTLRNYRKDGTLFYNELSISPIHDSHGAVTHFIGLQKDVTDRELLKQRVEHSLDTLKKTNANLRDFVMKDGLTGIYNRRYFDVQFPVQWATARRQHVPLGVFMVDIDHFKQFNDTYGHQAGDDCLKAIAYTLGKRFRRSSDFVARYGGEEFVVVTADTDVDKAQDYARELTLRVERLRIPHRESSYGTVTISLGFTVVIPSASMEPRDCIRRADTALYCAKQAGRNRSMQYAACKP